MTRDELLAYYKAADVALVTSLKDGMNLVAKEYCAAQIDERGVLVLSEFAGAAAELRVGALLVNPYDAEGLMESMVRACNMHPEEGMVRMRSMRDVVRSHNVFAWCRSFYRAARANTVEVSNDMAPDSAKITPFVPSANSWKQAAGSVG